MALTDVQLNTEAAVIKNETTPGANTATRVGTMLENIIDNKINDDKISTNTSLGTSDSLIPSQNAVKTYADTVAAAAGAGKELLVNKSVNTALGTSDTLYPTQNAVKTYVDGSVVGLLDDRGSYTPGLVSPGAFPSTGGSGVAGAIRKGDLWFMSAGGFLGTTAVSAGATVRALIDAPGQTAANWNVLSAGSIAITTPTLNQVATAGSISTIDLSVSRNIGGRVAVENTSNGSVAYISTTTGTSGSLALANTAGRLAEVYSENLTANRTYQLPNQSGTIALVSDIVNPIQSSVVTLNNAAITSGSPMQILAAPGAGKFIDVISVKTIFTPGGTPLDSPFSYGDIRYGIFAAAIITNSNLTINGANWFTQYSMNGFSQQLAFMENGAVFLALNTTMTGGVGNQIKVYITYQTVTI